MQERQGLSQNDKRRLVELVLASGLILALTTGLTSLYFRAFFYFGGSWLDLFFRVAVVVFIVSALRSYVFLLRGKTGGVYKIFIGIMLATFTVLLADLLEDLFIGSLFGSLADTSWAIVLPVFLGFNIFFFWLVFGAMYKAFTK